MLLLVGLGNPGAAYAANRHNIGFMAVDAIALRHGFAPWREKFSGLVTEGRLGASRVLALKPMTYMNRSGQSVSAALRFFKIPPAAVVVFHDDLDLAPGKIKIKRGGGHGGHNGLRDLDAHIGPDYLRVRLGIGHPGERDYVTHHVLGNFAASDKLWLNPLLEAIAAAAPHLLDGDGAGFLNDFALRTRPPKAGKLADSAAAKHKPSKEQDA